VVVELFAADIDWLGPTFRCLFRFWSTGGTSWVSVVICEALRFPSMRSSDSGGGRGAGFGGSTVGASVLEEVVATSPVFCSVVNFGDARPVRGTLPSTDFSGPH
jgi:hypothetical protein